MGAQPTPITLRRQLGAELRRLRGERTVAEVAGALGWSESKLSRIETARIGIRAADLDRLMQAYGLPDAVRRDLRDLVGQAHHQRNWWYAYSSAVPNPYEDYVAFEAEASAMYEWEAQVVPGLLQTDEYARVVIETGSTPHDLVVVERRVALRMGRQTVLTRQPAPRLWAILDEAVLRREIGGREVMRRQAQRLFDASQRDSITLQVLPFTAGVHQALAGSFTIFAFDGEKRLPIVHSEGLTGGVFRAKPPEVEAYQEAFEELKRQALDPDASRDFFAAVGRDFGSS